MIGRNFASLFHFNFGSGRHFAGLDDDEEVLLMKVLLIIEVVLTITIQRLKKILLLIRTMLTKLFCVRVVTFWRFLGAKAPLYLAKLSDSVIHSPKSLKFELT